MQVAGSSGTGRTSTTVGATPSSSRVSSIPSGTWYIFDVPTLCIGTVPSAKAKEFLLFSTRTVHWNKDREEIVDEILNVRASYAARDNEIPIFQYVDERFGQIGTVVCPHCLRAVNVGLGLHFRVIESTDRTESGSGLEIRWIRNKDEIDYREISEYRMFVRRQLPRVVRTVDTVAKFHHVWVLELRNLVASELPNVFMQKMDDFSFLRDGKGPLRLY